MEKANSPGRAKYIFLCFGEYSHKFCVYILHFYGLNVVLTAATLHE